MARRRRLAGGLVVLALGSLALLAFLLLRDGGVETQPPQGQFADLTLTDAQGALAVSRGRVIPAIDRQGVLHVKMTIETRGADGTVQDTEEREYWIDITGFRARVENSSGDGSASEVQVRSGTMLTTFSGGQFFRQEAPDQDTMWLNTIENELWGSYRALSLGAQSGEAILDGRQVETIRTDVTDEGQKIGERVAYLDAANYYLLLKEVYYKSTVDGGLAPSGERVYSYQTVEWLPFDQVSNTLLEPLTLASTGATRGRWTLTVAEANALKAFPLYYLDSEFRGLPLQKIEEYRNDRPMLGFQGVDIVYGVPPLVPTGAFQELRITQVSAQVETVGADLPTPWDSGTNVTVRGIDAILLEEGPITGLKLRLGDTLVIIWGQGKDEVLAAGEALVRLN